jgi:hypothetical protein
MRFTNLTRFYDYIQVPINKRKHSTKDDYFLSIFNLLQLFTVKEEFKA